MCLIHVRAQFIYYPTRLKTCEFELIGSGMANKEGILGHEVPPDLFRGPKQGAAALDLTSFYDLCFKLASSYPDALGCQCCFFFSFI